MIGRTLDHYRIESTLGEGGMGVVYKARDTHLDRTVAIKLLRTDKAADTSRRHRFYQEAKAASALNHPNIITIHDIRSVDGIDLIVMEFIPGRTLGDAIPEKGLPPAQALNYSIQAADGLARAHEAGIIHRDLKPSNFMVSEHDRRVKILDFGLAKLLEPAQSSPEDTTLTVLPPTEEGIVIGTAAYMSPEQASGLKLDARSDIFSFGSVLYEMLTGRRPFAANTALQILGKIQNDDPAPPRQINAAIPEELERIVFRCMRKDPLRRFQTMADLKAALEDVREESGSQKQARFPRKLRWAWLGLVPLAAVAIFFAAQASRSRESAEPLQASALTTLPGAELYPTFSPDGNHIAFTWSGPKQDNVDVYVQQIGSAGTPLRLTSAVQDDHNPVWSPDGHWIAFLRGDRSRPLSRGKRGLLLIPPLGGSARKLADITFHELTSNSAVLEWCPDSKCLIVTDSSGEGKPDALFVLSVETGERRPLTSPQPPVLADTNPVVSPDGQSLLFIRRSTWAIGQLHLLPLASGVTPAGEGRRIPLGRLNPDGVTWLPDSSQILFSAGAVSGRADLWKVSPAGDASPTRLPYVGEDGVMPTISRAQPGRPARLVYVRSFNDENIWRVDTAAPDTPPSIAISSTKADIHCMFSPDGRRVAFTSTRSGAWEIWLSDPDGSNAVQLTSLRARTGTGVPRWSRDGRLIVFASDAEGQFDIYVVAAAGGKPRNVTSHPGFDHVPSFSADGEWIYFSSARTGDYQLWKVRVTGAQPMQLTKNGGWVAHEAPGGGELYYTRTAAAGVSQPLLSISASGGQPVKVLETVTNSSFAVHQRGIYYGEQLPDHVRIQFYNFATRKSRTIASNIGNVEMSGGFTVSPDGRTILYSKRDAAIADLMLVENFR